MSHLEISILHCKSLLNPSHPKRVHDSVTAKQSCLKAIGGKCNMTTKGATFFKSTTHKLEDGQSLNFSSQRRLQHNRNIESGFAFALA
eukprot:5550857-Amphidinium_carterae.1